MRQDFTGLSVCALSETERRAGDLLREELFRRTRSMPSLVTEPTSVCIRLVCSDTIQDKDSFTIMQKDRLITILGRGIRALIYGYSMFGRRTGWERLRLTKRSAGTSSAIAASAIHTTRGRLRTIVGIILI